MATNRYVRVSSLITMLYLSISFSSRLRCIAIFNNHESCYTIFCGILLNIHSVLMSPWSSSLLSRRSCLGMLRNYFFLIAGVVLGFVSFQPRVANASVHLGNHDSLVFNQMRLKMFRQPQNRDNSSNSSALRWKDVSRSSRQLNDMQFLLPCEQLCKQCISIPTYFHIFTMPREDGDYVIPHPTSAVQDSKSMSDSFTSLSELKAMISDQMIILNDAYKKTPFKFQHMNPETPSRSFNYQYTNYAFDHYNEMSMKHGIGGLNSLNIFLCYSVGSRNVTSAKANNTLSSDLLAFASFPSHQLTTETIGGDGVFMRYDCLLRGGADGIDRGYTLVHEVGHWLGLYHTFQRNINRDPREFGEYNICSAEDENDFVDDTPASAGPSKELFPNCTNYLPNAAVGALNKSSSVRVTEPDSCPNLPGNDAIFNFMNYISNEACFENGVGYFTCGQIERMYHQWLLYRDRINFCIDNNFELELFIKFDRDWYYFEGKIFLMDVMAGSVLFNSTRDHDSLGVLLYQDSMVIDLCVPYGRYKVTVLDIAGDGFTKGSGSFIKSFVNGVEVESVSGNFGNATTIFISHLGNETKQGHESDDFPHEPDRSQSTVLRLFGLGRIIVAFVLFYTCFDI